MISKAIVLISVILAMSALLKANESVDLTFDWPDGIEIRVVRDFNRTTTIKGKEEDYTTQCSYVWSGSTQEGSYRIDFSDFKETIPESISNSKEPLVQLEYASRKIEPILPALIVDDNGQPISLEGVDVVKGLIQEEIDKINPQGEALLDRFKEILLSDASLQNRALEDWNRMIQVWSGVQDAAYGESFQGTSQTGEFSGKPIDNIWEYSVNRGSSENMVRLTIVQKPVAEDLERLLNGMLGGNVFNTLGIPEDSMLVFENYFETETNASTLVPVRYRKVKKWGASTDGGKTFIGRVDTWSYEFEELKTEEPSH